MSDVILFLQMVVSVVGGPVIAAFLLLGVMAVVFMLLASKDAEKRQLEHLRKCYGMDKKE